MGETTAEQVREMVDSVYRTDSRRVFATLIRLLGDFDLAEEALHDAFAAAVDQWPREGVPANPRAWLVSAGRFKAIDAMRRRARFDASLGELAERLDTGAAIRCGTDRRGGRGRPPAADLHLLPSGARAGGPGGPYAARSVRTDDRGHRQRVSHHPVHAGPADRAGQGENSRRADSLSGAVAGGFAGAAGYRAAGDLPGVQRGLRGLVGRVAHAAGSVGRGDSPGAAAGGAAAETRRWWGCWR